MFQQNWYVALDLRITSTLYEFSAQNKRSLSHGMGATLAQQTARAYEFNASTLIYIFICTTCLSLFFPLV